METAVINISRLLDESKRGKALSARLRSIAEKWQKDLGTVEQKLTHSRARLEKSGLGAPAEVTFRLQRDISILDMERRSLLERQRADIEGHREHFRAQLLDELQPILQGVCEERGLKIVMAVTGPELAFVAPDADITDVVMARLDEKKGA